MLPKISKSADILRKQGTKHLAKEIWAYCLQSEDLARKLKKVVGKEKYEQIVMFPLLGYWPRLEFPQTFNEKISNRKLHTDNDLYTKLSDKYAVREYVRDKVGDEILNEVYWVTEEPQDIPFEDLPNKFVVKSTHGSDMINIVDDKSTVDFDEIISECENWLQTEFGSPTNEYWYQRIDPKIIVENKIQSDKYKVPVDFKFFVFHGQVECIQVDVGRFDEHSRCMYGPDWELEDYTIKYPKGKGADEPEMLDEMIGIAEKLGEDLEFARVDLYQPKSDKIVFGEITLSPGAGYEWFSPPKYDFILGSYW
ncbi:ATP-grasp fold amidoligase family protein [Haloarcula sp. NS06]|uniref:ATP-grasp fold amidoligase family protein n=1 Tax=Haloarcula sp. NS06 TaxID=3409688 RepID=UPI003DA7A094